MNEVRYDLVVLVIHDGDEYAHRVSVSHNLIPRVGEEVSVYFSEDTRMGDSDYVMPGKSMVTGTVEQVHHTIEVGHIDQNQPHRPITPTVVFTADMIQRD